VLLQARCALKVWCVRDSECMCVRWPEGNGCVRVCALVALTMVSSSSSSSLAVPVANEEMTASVTDVRTRVHTLPT